MTHAILATRRLALHELQLRDAAELVALDASERVRALLLDDALAGLDQALALIAWARRFCRARPGLGPWACREREAGRFIGIFSLMPVADSADVEIGARLLPAFWGRGYPVEMGRALCAHAFGRLGLPRLVGLCHPHNRGAQLALRRLGFRLQDEPARHFGRPAQRWVLWADDVPLQRVESISGPKSRVMEDSAGVAIRAAASATAAGG